MRLKRDAFDPSRSSMYSARRLFAGFSPAGSSIRRCGSRMHLRRSRRAARVAVLPKEFQPRRPRNCTEESPGELSRATALHSPGPLVYPHNKLQSQITESNSFGVSRGMSQFQLRPREGVFGPAPATAGRGDGDSVGGIGGRERERLTTGVAVTSSRGVARGTGTRAEDGERRMESREWDPGGGHRGGGRREGGNGAALMNLQ